MDQSLFRGKISLLSHHGKYISAQPDGRLVADREKAKGWEHFKVLDGRRPVVTEATSSSGSTSTDPADGITGKVLVQGHHGFYVSANATCQENECGNAETIEVIKVAPRVVAFRSCFGKYLSGKLSHLCYFCRLCYVLGLGSFLMVLLKY